MSEIVVVADSEPDESTADVVADAVAEAVADAVPDVQATAVTDVDLSVEHRLTVVEIALAELTETVRAATWKAEDAQITANVALAEAESAPDLGDIENMIEATEFTEDKDGEIEADAPDVPPAGTGTSVLFDSWSGLKNRFGKKVTD